MPTARAENDALFAAATRTLGGNHPVTKQLGAARRDGSRAAISNAWAACCALPMDQQSALIGAAHAPSAVR